MMKGMFGVVDGRVTKRIRRLTLVLLVAGVASGCAAKKATVGAPVFFPPPPDEPHVQYLTGVSTSADMAEKQSDLSRLVTGGSQTVLKFGKPFGIAFHQGKLYVTDTAASQVVVLDPAKKSMKNLNTDRGAAELKKPIGVAVDDDGNIYVADNARKDIAMYTSEGKYVRSLGKNLKSNSLVGVAAYRQYLLALDNRQGKIFVMDRKSGELLSTIGENEDATKNMAFPNGISVDSKGNIHVVNMGNGKVKIYDLDGHLLSEFGQLGDNVGEFTRPRGVAVDAAGNIFVSDAGHQVVQVFNEKHRILGYFGSPGLPAGSLNLPAGVAVTSDNLDVFQQYAAPGFKLQAVIAVVNQYASPINHFVAFYGLGEMEGKKGEEKVKKAEAKEQAPAKKDEAKEQAAPKKDEAAPKK